jgi:hypothetical protein
MLDAYNRDSYAVALAPGAKITTTQIGAAVDLASVNNGSNSLVFVAAAGVITDGTFTFKLQDSPDNFTWNDVPSPYVQAPASVVWNSGTAVGTTLKLGYLGNANGANRYVRVVIVVGGSPAIGGYITVIAQLGLAGINPAS